MLQRLVDEVRLRPRLPYLMFDPMLPGQRLQFRSDEPGMDRLAERGEIGVLGFWRGSPLRCGVSAAVEKLGPGSWELRAQRHVKVLGPAETDEDGLDVAKFELVEDEVLERDVEVARTLAPLVERWCGLVEGTRFERFSGQVQGILADLGPMPLAEEPGRLAMWVAALVNPLPALGVAYEIRPAALTARTVGERLQVALDGIQGSIGHLTGERPLF